MKQNNDGNMESSVEIEYESLVGLRVMRRFSGFGDYWGYISGARIAGPTRIWYRVDYDDGDSEDCNLKQIHRMAEVAISKVSQDPQGPPVGLAASRQQAHFEALFRELQRCDIPASTDLLETATKTLSGRIPTITDPTVVLLTDTTPPPPPSSSSSSAAAAAAAAERQTTTTTNIPSVSTTSVVSTIKSSSPSTGRDSSHTCNITSNKVTGGSKADRLIIDENISANDILYSTYEFRKLEVQFLGMGFNLKSIKKSFSVHGGDHDKCLDYLLSNQEEDEEEEKNDHDDTDKDDRDDVNKEEEHHINNEINEKEESDSKGKRSNERSTIITKKLFKQSKKDKTLKKVKQGRKPKEINKGKKTTKKNKQKDDQINDNIESQDEKEEEEMYPCQFCNKMMNSSALILCDGCDVEECLLCANLLRMPSEDEPWYCKNCTRGLIQQKKNDEDTSMASSSPTSTSPPLLIPVPTPSSSCSSSSSSSTSSESLISSQQTSHEPSSDQKTPSEETTQPLTAKQVEEKKALGAALDRIRKVNRKVSPAAPLVLSDQNLGLEFINKKDSGNIQEEEEEEEEEEKKALIKNTNDSVSSSPAIPKQVEEDNKPNLTTMVVAEMENGEVKLFSSQSECADYLGVNRSRVSECINGITNSTGKAKVYLKESNNLSQNSATTDNIIHSPIKHKEDEVKFNEQNESVNIHQLKEDKEEVVLKDNNEKRKTTNVSLDNFSDLSDFDFDFHHEDEEEEKSGMLINSSDDDNDDDDKEEGKNSIKNTKRKKKDINALIPKKKKRNAILDDEDAEAPAPSKMKKKKKQEEGVDVDGLVAALSPKVAKVVDGLCALGWLEVQDLEAEVLAGLSLLPEGKAVEMLDRVAQAGNRLTKDGSGDGKSKKKQKPTHRGSSLLNTLVKTYMSIRNTSDHRLDDDDDRFHKRRRDKHDSYEYSDKYSANLCWKKKDGEADGRGGRRQGKGNFEDSGKGSSKSRSWGKGKGKQLDVVGNPGHYQPMSPPLSSSSSLAPSNISSTSNKIQTDKYKAHTPVSHHSTPAITAKQLSRKDLFKNWHDVKKIARVEVLLDILQNMPSPPTVPPPSSLPLKAAPSVPSPPQNSYSGRYEDSYHTTLTNPTTSSGMNTIGDPFIDNSGRGTNSSNISQSANALSGGKGQGLGSSSAYKQGFYDLFSQYSIQFQNTKNPDFRQVAKFLLHIINNADIDHPTFHITQQYLPISFIQGSWKPSQRPNASLRVNGMIDALQYAICKHNRLPQFVTTPLAFGDELRSIFAPYYDEILGPRPSSKKTTPSNQKQQSIKYGESYQRDAMSNYNNNNNAYNVNNINTQTSHSNEQYTAQRTQSNHHQPPIPPQSSSSSYQYQLNESNDGYYNRQPNNGARNDGGSYNNNWIPSGTCPGTWRQPKN